MSGARMTINLLLDRLAFAGTARIPEESPVMDDPGHADAFDAAGSDGGILAFLYLYHAIQATTVIRPGDTVLDLACGSANQLLQTAMLNPEADFVGVDASARMLDKANALVERHGVRNIQVRLGDMTDLTEFAVESVDCVTCTMSLHHLADNRALASAFSEMGRILRRNGGVYVADFGRMNRSATMRHFSEDWKDEQSAAFTRDFLHSLHAAFTVSELATAAANAGHAMKRFTTPLAPFLVVCKTGERREWTAQMALRAQQRYEMLTRGQQRKFHALSRWLRAGGCRLPSRIQ